MTPNEAAELLVESMRQVSAARAEAVQLRLWLRAAMRVVIEQHRTIDHLRGQLQRERQQHRDLMESIQLAREVA
jgi:hypothetical protein